MRSIGMFLLAVTACGNPATSPDSMQADSSAPDAPAFTPPYELCRSGEVVPIPTAGRNTANDVKPTAHDNGSWQYSLFQSYGGGVFQPAYSVGGAYVFAGQGGHDVPPLFGAAVFDFTNGMWSYLPNGNGFDENRATEVITSETTGFPYIELANTSSPQMPTPGHPYQLMIAQPGPGEHGSVIRIFGTAITANVWDTFQSHAIDLTTGKWTRAADNLASDAFSAGQLTEQVATLDPVTNRVYVAGEWPNGDHLAYLDLTDRRWKTSPTFSNPPGGEAYVSMWVDVERRLLLALSTPLHSGTVTLWAFDLENIAAGPKLMDVDGTLPPVTGRWHKYPTSDGGDGAYYTLRGHPSVSYDTMPAPPATEQVLYKLTPPASDPLNNKWTYTTVPISGGITGEYVTDLLAGARHQTRFFYVPSIRCFAWIPNGSGPVELIKP